MKMSKQNENDPIIITTEQGLKASLMLIAAYAAIMIAHPDRSKTPEQNTRILEDEVDKIVLVAKQRMKEEKLNERR